MQLRAKLVVVLRCLVATGGEFDRINREERHFHRASCDDSGGNLICGFPAGPTIASPGA
jgi:hypothetical protein